MNAMPKAAYLKTIAMLAGKELRALRRDWHGLLVLFAMPAVFILVMSLALRDTFQPPTLELGVPLLLDEAHTVIATADADAVELALWCHDVIFVPGAADNEARSAGWILQWGTGIARADRIASNGRWSTANATGSNLPR